MNVSRIKINFFRLKILKIVFSAFIALGLLQSSTFEYSSSTRGKSDLTIDENGRFLAATDGLSYEYITQFSMGIFESLNIIIPRINGGSSTENLD